MSAIYFWLIVGVLLLILEIATPGTFFMVSLALGCFAAGLVSLVVPATWAPWLAFCAASTLSIALSRRLVSALDRAPQVPLNVDALVGQRALVIESIEPHEGKGLVRVGGEEWRAEAHAPIEKGKWVYILAVRGTRLIVDSTQSLPSIYLEA